MYPFTSNVAPHWTWIMVMDLLFLQIKLDYTATKLRLLVYCFTIINWAARFIMILWQLPNVTGVLTNTSQRDGSGDLNGDEYKALKTHLSVLRQQFTDHWQPGPYTHQSFRRILEHRGKTWTAMTLDFCWTIWSVFFYSVRLNLVKKGLKQFDISFGMTVAVLLF